MQVLSLFYIQAAQVRLEENGLVAGHTWDLIEESHQSNHYTTTTAPEIVLTDSDSCNITDQCSFALASLSTKLNYANNNKPKLQL